MLLNRWQPRATADIPASVILLQSSRLMLLSRGQLCATADKPVSVISMQPSRLMLLNWGHPVAIDIRTTVPTFWHLWTSIETIDGHAIPSKVVVVISSLLHSLIRIIVTGIPLPSTHLNDEWQCSYASMVSISIALKHLSHLNRSHPAATAISRLHTLNKSSQLNRETRQSSLILKRPLDACRQLEEDWNILASRWVKFGKGFDHAVLTDVAQVSCKGVRSRSGRGVECI